MKRVFLFNKTFIKKGNRDFLILIREAISRPYGPVSRKKKLPASAFDSITTRIVKWSGNEWNLSVVRFEVAFVDWATLVVTSAPCIIKRSQRDALRIPSMRLSPFSLSKLHPAHWVTSLIVQSAEWGNLCSSSRTIARRTNESSFIHSAFFSAFLRTSNNRRNIKSLRVPFGVQKVTIKCYNFFQERCNGTVRRICKAWRMYNQRSLTRCGETSERQLLRASSCFYDTRKTFHVTRHKKTEKFFKRMKSHNCISHKLSM